MKFWPFSKKAAHMIAMKSSSYLVGMGGSRGGLTGASYDQLSTEGYSQNAVVNACINKIANSIASIDRKLYQKDKSGKLTLVESHPLLDLLARPNPTQSGDEFMRALIAYRQIAGNAYIRGNGIDPMSRSSKPPSELTLLNPGKVKVEPGKTYFPQYFEYKPSSSTTYEFQVDQISGRSEVLQLKTFNPLNAWYGLPPMTAAAYGIDINNSGQRWNKKLLDNDARPAGALVVNGVDGKPGSLTDEQYQRLQEMIDTTISGSANAGKPLLLEGGLDWKQMSMNAKDMDFKNSKNSSAIDIGLVFGVPSQLLGIPGSLTFANMQEAKLYFWEETVLPLNDLILDALNLWLVPLFGDNLVLKYDMDSISALEPRRKEKSDRITKSTFMTINEKRRVMGEDALPNNIGDAILIESRGVLLGLDGKVTDFNSIGAVTSGEPAQVPDAAKHQKWLEGQGYTPERAERLTKLAYGQ